MPRFRLPRPRLSALPRPAFLRNIGLADLARLPVARSDTMLGVCHALGEDFGFNPMWLRAALPLALFFAPAATIAGYLAAFLLIHATRLMVREPSAAAAADVPVAAPETETEIETGADREPLPLAA